MIVGRGKVQIGESSVMTRLMFARRECGDELRVITLCDDKQQIYTCRDCHHQIVLIGTVNEIHACKNPKSATPGDWVRVTDQITDVACD
jgi:hypothetical protein